MSTFTTNIGLEQPINGADVDSWDVPVNADWALIDQALGTTTTQAFTNVDVTLTVAQAAFFQITCTGVLSGNVNLVFPSAIGGRRVIQNNCTGAFTLTAKNGAGDTGGGIVCGQGYQTPILLTAGRAYYDNTGNIKSGKGSIASGTTTDLGSVPQGAVTVSGTTTITSFGSSAAVGESKLLTFSGILTLTYNAVSLILPSAANITTAAGDTALVNQTAAGNWTCLVYQRASGVALVVGAGVSSFNARTGAVLPVTDDYQTSDLTTAANSTAPSATRLGQTLTSSGAGVALGTTSSVASNVCSVTLTAGHWRCFATACQMTNSGAATTVYGGSVTLTTGVAGVGFFQFSGVTIPASNILSFAVPDLIVRVNVNTVVYLVMWNGSAGGGSGTGTLTCQRTD